MKAMEKDWYKKIWTLDIQNISWVEDTEHQVDYLIDKLELKGNERILDLACGFGRHSLEFARRGIYNTIRLYTLNEITEIFSGLGLCVEDSFADFSGSSSSENEIQFV